jgi:hypothetical protein
MRRFIVGIAALFLSTTTAFSQTVEDVIGAQLDAFNARDLPTAFGFASPMIKGVFGNPGNFGTMVSRGYPMVWNNSDVRFLEPRQDGSLVFQRVMMRDENGAVHVIEYKMIPVDDSWQIDGVALMAPAVGA